MNTARNKLRACKFICVLISERGAAEFVLEALECLISHPHSFRVRIYVSEPVNDFIQRQHSRIASDAEIFISTSELLDFHSDIISTANCLLSSATSNSSERQLSKLAKEFGVPIIHIVDALYGYKKRFVFSGEMYHFDAIVVIDEEAKKEAVRDGLPSSVIHALGHPAWEAIGSGSLATKGVQNISTRNTIFLGAPIKQDYGNTLGFCEDDAWNLMVESWQKLPSMFDKVIYCPHPQQTKIPELYGAELHSYDLEMLVEFNQVFGIFSAPLMHAALVGCLAISLQPSEHGHDVCAFSRRGYIPRAASVSEIGVLLNQYSWVDRVSLMEKLDGSKVRLMRLIRDFASVGNE